MQAREERLVVGHKVGEDVLVCTALEVLAADLDRDHLLIGQGGREAPMPEADARPERGIVLADQAVHGDDKLVAVHGGAPFAASRWWDTC